MITITNSVCAYVMQKKPTHDIIIVVTVINQSLCHRYHKMIILDNHKTTE